MQCSICRREHDIQHAEVAFGLPDAYFDVPEVERAARCYANAESNADFCVIQPSHFFIRCRLEINVIGREQPFGFGAWAEVSEQHMRRYAELWADPQQGLEPPFAGTLANRLRGYDMETLGTPVEIQLTSLTQRPKLRIADSSHPLAREVAEGLSVERVLAALHAHGIG